MTDDNRPAGGGEHDGIIACPECGEPMYADEEWKITDTSLIGTEIGDGGISGDYAHARCVGPDKGRTEEGDDA